MSIIAKFRVPAGPFALAETMNAYPDICVESEHIATHSLEWVLPFVWMSGEPTHVISDALDRDSTVEEATPIQKTDRETLYEIHWGEKPTHLVNQILDQHGIMHEITGEDGEWTMELRFVSRKVLSEFRDYFREHGDFFELEHVYTPTEPRQTEYGLTPEQYEALTTAVELGYFAVPRESNLSEVADELGISTNSASQRLRRATLAVTRRALMVSD